MDTDQLEPRMAAQSDDAGHPPSGEARKKRKRAPTSKKRVDRSAQTIVFALGLLSACLVVFTATASAGWNDLCRAIFDMAIACAGLFISGIDVPEKPREGFKALLSLRFAAVLLGFASLGRAFQFAFAEIPWANAFVAWTLCIGLAIVFLGGAYLAGKRVGKWWRKRHADEKEKGSA